MDLDTGFVALSNPKAVLFFAAFLPQFISILSAASSSFNQACGGLFIAIGAVLPLRN